MNETGDRMKPCARAGRRVLVTGSTGLIGRETVARLLQNGDHVIAIVRHEKDLPAAPGLTSVEIDLTHFRQSDLATVGAIDGVIHLAQAAGWHNFPVNAGDVAAVTLTATARLAEAAVSNGAEWFVLASSGGVYGASGEPIRETDPISIGEELGFYLGAKATSEGIAEAFRSDLSVSILRPFFVYGPNQPDSFLIPRLIRSVRTGASIRVNEGRGPRLNPIWVADAGAAFFQVTQLSEGHTLNIAGPQVTTLRDIVRIIGEIMGKTPVFDRVEERPNDFVAEISAMCEILGAPRVCIADGLRRMVGDAPRG